MPAVAVNSTTAPISQSDAVTAPMLPAMHRPWPYPILDADVTSFHVYTEDEVEEELRDKRDAVEFFLGMVVPPCFIMAELANRYEQDSI
jgi:hypothetical protein